MVLGRLWINLKDNTMRGRGIANPLSRFFIFTALLTCHVRNVLPQVTVTCYTCSNTQTPSTDCLGSKTCGYDEVCMNTIRDENGQHRVTKECKQTAACNNQQSQNANQCHPETSPSVCYYCCDTNLCNAQEVPSAVVATTVATTEGSTTTKLDTSTILTQTPKISSPLIRTSTTGLQGGTTHAGEEQATTTQADGFVSCYTCSDTQTPSTDCLGSMICGLDEVCMNTIRDENGLHRVSKECKQTAACNNQQSQNVNQCHPETSSSVCYYCCDTYLCNEQEIPGTVAATTVSTTEDVSTIKYDTSSISTYRSIQISTSPFIQRASTTKLQGATTPAGDNQPEVATEADGIVSCFTCSDTQSPSTDCLGSTNCGFDEVCMNTIRDENGLHRVSKECKQTAACNNQQSQNVNQCHPETSPSVCYYCCDTDLCNEQEIPDTFVATTVSTTEDATTMKYDTSSISTYIQISTSSFIGTTSTTKRLGATTPVGDNQPEVATEADGIVSCFTCSDTQTPSTDCLGSTTCAVDEVCMNTIRDENGLHRVTKECKQTAACNNQQSQNVNQCHPETSPSVCYYCCDTDLCNAQEMPGTVDATTVSTTQDATTIKYDTSSMSTYIQKATSPFIHTTTDTKLQGTTTPAGDNQAEMMTTQADGIVSCYTCSDTQTPSTDCLGSTTCAVDEVCMNTIRDENGLHRVSKECKQSAACSNQQNQNVNQCHPETSPSVCYYCCDTDLCNEQEIPGTVVTTTVSTTEDATTIKYDTSSISTYIHISTSPFIYTTPTTRIQGATSPTDVNQAVATQADGIVSCYTCSNTQTPNTDCLGSSTCGLDEICLNTIRDENGQHRVSKECKQTAACNNQQSQNVNQCHPETSPSVCYYCCDTDLCNEQEVPGDVGATTIATTTSSTTEDYTTMKSDTCATSLTFSLGGELAIPSEEVFMTEFSHNVIRCAVLCHSHCCKTFVFDSVLSHCNLSKQEPSEVVPKEGSLLYNIYQYTT